MKFEKSVSSQPRKKRKASYSAPLHKARVYLHANLSKELRKKLNSRSALIRKGFTVKVMRGSHSKATGKVSEVDYKTRKVYIEGIGVQARKSKKQALLAFEASKLQIIDTASESKPKPEQAKQVPREVAAKKEAAASKESAAQSTAAVQSAVSKPSQPVAPAAQSNAQKATQ